MIDTQLLEEIGFSKGEVKVYFALLEFEQVSIGPLSKKSGVTPAKVYLILNKLISKGLCSSVIKSGKKYFEAASPKKIIEYLEEKDKKIKFQKEEIKLLLPQIEMKKKFSQDSQTSTVYQGYEGLRTLYNEILVILENNEEDFIGFTLGKEEYENIESKYFFDEFDTKRRALKIKTKLIGNITQREFLKEANKDRNLEIRFANYQTPTGLIIFGDNIAILNWQKIPFAFVISSRQIADSYKKFFEDMWKLTKP